MGNGCTHHRRHVAPYGGQGAADSQSQYGLQCELVEGMQGRGSWLTKESLLETLDPAGDLVELALEVLDGQVL